MKIAQVAPLFESVPPQRYGGTERVVSYLTEELVRMGHRVTLFASGDSRTAARLVPIVDRSLRLHPMQPDWLGWHTIMLDRVFSMASQFDIIHFHTDYLHFPFSRSCKVKTLTTIHGRVNLPGLPAVYRHFADMPIASISDHQRQPIPWANWTATVHHGLPNELYHFCPRGDDYFAFVGRVSPEKRLDRAIEIAIACNTPLRIAAKVDRADEAYFQQRIEPLLHHRLITFHGEIGDDEKNAFIGRAKALLFPIDWPEPFGLVMIEALACGTPVLAYACGSVPEILEHGVTGYIVDNQRDAIEAARHIGQIDRRACRLAFERRFTARRMANDYLAVYEDLLGDGEVLPLKASVAGAAGA